MWLIPIACIFSAAAGFTQPFMGIIFAKVMNLLTVPVDMYTMLKGPDYLEDETNFWVIMTVIVAFVCLIGMTFRGAAFGFIG